MYTLATLFAICCKFNCKDRRYTYDDSNPSYCCAMLEEIKTLGVQRGATVTCDWTRRSEQTLRNSQLLYSRGLSESKSSGSLTTFKAAKQAYNLQALKQYIFCVSCKDCACMISITCAMVQSAYHQSRRLGKC